MRYSNSDASEERILGGTCFVESILLLNPAGQLESVDVSMGRLACVLRVRNVGAEWSRLKCEFFERLCVKIGEVKRLILSDGIDDRCGGGRICDSIDLGGGSRFVCQKIVVIDHRAGCIR